MIQRDRIHSAADTPDERVGYFNAEAKKQRGRIVSATVVGMSANYLDFRLSEMPLSTNGVMHISQASDTYLPTLNGMFAKGQVIFVMVLFLRSDLRWEVSLKTVGLQERWNSTYPIGANATGHVTRFGIYGALIALQPGFVGRMPPFGDDILKRAGLLEEGAQVNVVVGKWDETHRDSLLFPADTFHADGIVTELDFKISAKGTRGYASLHIDCDKAGRFICDASRLVNISERFPVGTPVVVEFRHPHNDKAFYKNFEGYANDELVGRLLLPSGQSDKYSSLPAIGSTIDMVIGQVSDRFLIGPIADNVKGFLHRTQVVRDTVNELRRHVRPLDTARAMVGPPRDTRYEFSLDFVAIVAQGPGWLEKPTSDATLFRLSDERREGRAGGFTRATTFRDLVLDAYHHTCAICGKCQRLGQNYSAAEAAHIIPHGDRGAETLSNGICFCKFHHWAFDRGLFGVDRNNRIVVSRHWIQPGEGIANELLDLDGALLTIPDGVEVPSDALNWHFRNIFADTAGMMRV